MPFIGPSAYSFTEALIASTVAGRDSTAVKSITETVDVGTRKAIPVNLPFSSGMTSPTAFAAPVSDGTMFMAAARAFGLDFVPLATEPYDLVVAPGAMESPQLAPLWSLLQSDRFKASVEELGGYSAKEMGRRIR